VTYQPALSLATSLPADWDSLWGVPTPTYRRELLALRLEMEALAQDVPCFDESDSFGHVVHPYTNRVRPVHRWFSYKEAYAPELPREVVARLGTGKTGLVVDAFAGVATTQLSLASDPRVTRCIGVEYSPFAHFVGSAKLDWPNLDAKRLASKVDEVMRFQRRTHVNVPELAGFHNPEIMHPETARDLVSVRERIREVSRGANRRFLLVGLAAVLEDVTSAYKDGRALRIARGRTRRSSSLAGEVGLSVRQALRRQYTAMLADLKLLAAQRETMDVGKTAHVRGDARDLAAALPDDVAEGDVGLFAYSPPYLNCIDYTEVYKLELWLLELVTNQASFRNVRLGTLRSHPSIDFPPRGYLEAILGRRHDLVFILRALSSFVERHRSRTDIGKVVWNYFDDICKVLHEQYKYLEPGGYAVCVVANSTFSRRERDDDRWVEQWRLPILTDVLTAKLAQAIGFDPVTIWHARDLQPRNVTSGSARESLVVMRKPSTA
jgi:hypothetical protein